MKAISESLMLKLFVRFFDRVWKDEQRECGAEQNYHRANTALMPPHEVAVNTDRNEPFGNYGHSALAVFRGTTNGNAG